MIYTQFTTDIISGIKEGDFTDSFCRGVANFDLKLKSDSGGSTNPGV
jgi:hypothetical protein